MVGPDNRIDVVARGSDYGLAHWWSTQADPDSHQDSWGGKLAH
ncbi:hypothetical protein [Kutzneria sp. CA-103260]|nr:hypothetical protein [Kutzneria sp. CA-103260]